LMTLEQVRALLIKNRLMVSTSAEKEEELIR